MPQPLIIAGETNESITCTLEQFETYYGSVELRISIINDHFTLQDCKIWLRYEVFEQLAAQLTAQLTPNPTVRLHPARIESPTRPFGVERSRHAQRPVMRRKKDGAVARLAAISACQADAHVFTIIMS